MIASRSDKGEQTYQTAHESCFLFAACLLLAFLCSLPFATVQAQTASTQVFDAYGQIHSEPGREQMAEVIVRGQEELNRILHHALKDAVSEIQVRRAELEYLGIKPGMSFEIDLGLGSSVSIDVEHLPKLLAWNKTSPPDFPLKAKIESKHKGVGVEKTGSMEIVYDPQALSTRGIKSIKLEYEADVLGQTDKVAVEISGTADDPSVKVEYGRGIGVPKDFEKAHGFGGSIEQTIGLDFGRDAGKYYDDDMVRSDWWIVRRTEDLVAKITWGVEASLKREEKVGRVGKMKTEFKTSLGTDQVRSSYTDWLFKDATQGAEDLNRHLDDQVAWRRARIEYEAQRLGIDLTGKKTAELIQEIQSTWERDPSLKRPVFRGRDLEVSEIDQRAMEEDNRRRAEDHRIAQAYFRAAWEREEQRLRERERLEQQRFQEWLVALADRSPPERAQLAVEAGLSTEQIAELERGLASGWFADHWFSAMRQMMPPKLAPSAPVKLPEPPVVDKCRPFGLNTVAACGMHMGGTRAVPVADCIRIFGNKDLGWCCTGAGCTDPCAGTYPPGHGACTADELTSTSENDYQQRLSAAKAKYDAAFNRYTVLSTTGGTGSIEQAQREAQEAYQELKELGAQK